MVHVFPTLAEFRSVLHEFFDEVSASTPSYSLGDRCLRFVLRTTLRRLALSMNPSIYPLTSLQKSMALAWMRAPRSGAYILQYVCEMAEELDDTLLESAWRQMVQRYAPLRTSITLDADNKLWQRVHERAEIKWQRLDWSDKSADERSAQLAEFLRADWDRGFAFDGSVPIRITLIRASRTILHADPHLPPRAAGRTFARDRVAGVVRDLRRTAARRESICPTGKGFSRSH